MKKALLAVLLALGILGAVAPVTVDALTDDQQNALTMLLRSFGADDSTIHDFQGAVLGASTGPTDDYGSGNTASTGIYCPKLTSTIQRGARDAGTGGQVTELQLFLADYFSLNEEDVATGFFGRLTQKYVTQFQQEKGLPAFGIVGSLTRVAIAQACGGSAAPTPSTTTGTTPGTQGTGGTPVPGGTTPTLTGSLSFFVALGGIQSGSFGEGTDIGPLMLTIKNSSLLTQSITFPNNCWYTYRVLDKDNGNKIVFDLSAIQQCVSAESWTSTTFTLKPGESKQLEVTHRYQTFHIPPGNYSMVFDLNSRVPYKNAASFDFRVGPGSGTGGANTISITSPNGGEQWEIGQLNTITWSPYSYIPTTVNPASDVNVELVKKTASCASNARCTEYTSVGKIMDTGKASLHTYFNLNDYQTYAEPGQYYVRATNRSTGATDVSDAPFTLLPRGIDIKVNGSDGPITLSDNQAISVSFKAGTSFTSCTLNGVRSTPGGSPGVQLSNSSLATAYNGYAYAPASVPGASTAIYIACAKADGTTRGDAVQVNLLSSAASIQVASPNGGEVLPINQPASITWSQSGIKSPSIALYKNDQWMKWLATDYVSDDGKQLFTWTPSGVEAEAAPLGQVFKIYITGQKRDGTGYTDDKSDAPFSFYSTPATPSLKIQVSPGTIQAGQSATLTWSSENAQRCYLSYGSSQEQVALSGSKSVSPTATTEYKLWCANDPGTGKDGPSGSVSVILNVGPAASTGVLHAVGVYEAQGAQHNFCYSKPAHVAVNLMQYQKSGTPVTLSLSAYEPVIWDLNVPAGINLQQVILSGYNVQSVVITGASPLVTRYFYQDPSNAARGSSGQGAFYDDRDGADSRNQTIYHWAGQATCAATSGAVPVANRWYYNAGTDYFYAYQKGDSNYTTLANKLQTITGLPIKTFTGAYSGSVFTVPIDTPPF